MARSSIHARAAVALVPLLLALAARVPPAEAARWFDAPMLAQLSYNPVDELLPTRLVSGDLNSDGSPDVVSWSPFGMAVYLGAGDGTFDAPSVDPGVQMAWFSIADLDGDGASDIACTAAHARCVLFGDGSGRHWTRVDLSPPINATGQVVLDVDGDGRLDVVSLWWNGGIQVDRGLPGRTFVTSTSTADSLAGGVIWNSVPADFDGDGRPDFTVSQQYGDHDLIVLLSRGDGTFRARVVVGDVDWQHAFGMAASDVTGDGHTDLVVAREEIVSIHPGLGDGTFGVPLVIDTPDERVLDVAIADVTQDGQLDLVSTDDAHLAVLVRPGLGGGGFGPAIRSTIGRSLFPLIVEDLDGDERADIVSTALAPNTSSDALYSALGDGQGRFGVCELTRPITSAFSIAAVGDLDEDGHPDLLALDPYAAPGQFGVDALLARPGRTFSRADHAEIPAPQCCGALPAFESVDADEDGHLDFATLGPGSAVTVLAGVGDGTVAGTFSIALPAGSTGMHFADVTGDGHLDLVAVVGADVFVRPGLGGGAFGPAVRTQRPLTITHMKVGDLNGDGRADIVYTAWLTGSGYSTSYALSVGDGGFGAATFLQTNGDEAEILIEDLDGDGRLDLSTLFRGYGPGGFGDYVMAYLQDAAGTLGAPSASSGVYAWPGFGAAPCDLDADGHPDLVYQIEDGLLFGRGNGAGGFVAAGGLGGLDPNWNAGRPLADFDGDGRLDVASRDASSIVVVWGRDPIPPTVALLGPGVLPALTPGASATLRWQAHDDVGVAAIDLFVSRHGPRGPFARIATGLADSGEFPWTVTAPLSDSVAFKIVARDSAGNVAHAVSAERLRIVDPLAVGSAPAPPARLAITALAPNPARARCAVRFALPRAGHVTLALHDLQGRRLATLLDAERTAGEGAIDWTLASAGAPLRPGLYFLRLTAGRERAVARLVIAN